MKITAIINYGQELFSQNLIKNCLKTLSFCHEIVLVDFSKKGIASELVREFNLRVVRANFKNNFSYLRNLGAKEAKNEWLFYIDPDERVSPALAKKIELVIKDNNFSAYSVSRKNYYLGKRFKHAGAWPDKVLRLIKKESLVKWEGSLHEQAKIKGKVGFLKEPLTHLTHRNIEEMTKKTLNWSKLEADLRLKVNHPKMSSWRFWRVLFTSFWDNFVCKKACFEGTEGVIEGIFQVFSTFFTYVRLWEMQQKPGLSDKYEEIDAEILKKWQIK